jgi:hypothetical protein
VNTELGNGVAESDGFLQRLAGVDKGALERGKSSGALAQQEACLQT